MVAGGLQAYDGLHQYMGDIHNHCGISYGHGSIEDAFGNARMQLDFASVTGHGYWHDIPEMQSDDYHVEGFKRLESLWPYVQDVTESFNNPGKFVTFLSFEWHSREHGDYCVYYKGSKGEILREDSLDALRQRLRVLTDSGQEVMAIPHHIGYRRGRRGLNWDDFTPEFSPVVEMVSMHGCGENDEAPRPYLHTMGPRDSGSMMIEGLRRGQQFGVIGSSDHHSAHPGSHGHGRMGVWAERLTRDDLWRAIAARRTYALTGDRIDLRTTVNGAPMGASIEQSRRRVVDVAVTGGDALDRVDIMKNGSRVFSWTKRVDSSPQGYFDGLVPIQVGWGHRDVALTWDVRLEVMGGHLRGVEPRFRGSEVLDPLREDPGPHLVSAWQQLSESVCAFSTVTFGNSTTTTDETQGVCLHVVGDDSTRIVADFNGQHVEFSIQQLRHGGTAGYLDGSNRGAYRAGRAVEQADRSARFTWVDETQVGWGDSYYARVRQTNDQWAWSSPVWVGAERP